MGSEIELYRDEAEEIKKIKGWLLIYGRRKVGKTFLIKNFLAYDIYFTVRRDGKIIAEKYPLREINNLGLFLDIAKGQLKERKTIIIDEFQRLPPFALDELALLHPQGKIIFSGSSLRIIKKIFRIKSPLLGLVAQYPLGLIKPKNILRELSGHLSGPQIIESAVFLMDPWTLSFFRKEESLEFFYHLLSYSKLTIPALVGEVFTEEERELTKVYEAIIKLLGSGEWDYRKIASLLANRKIIENADSSSVLPYIKNLKEMGLVEELPLFSSKKSRYRLLSPIMEAFYYLSDRYDFEEREVSFSEVKPTLEKIRNLAVQNFVADLFAQQYKGKKEYFVDGKKEIDFIITVRNKPVIIGEVKWGDYSLSDLKNFKEKTKDFSCKKVFVAKEKKGSLAGIEIITARDLIKDFTGVSSA